MSKTHNNFVTLFCVQEFGNSDGFTLTMSCQSCVCYGGQSESLLFKHMFLFPSISYLKINSRNVSISHIWLGHTDSAQGCTRLPCLTLVKSVLHNLFGNYNSRLCFATLLRLVVFPGLAFTQNFNIQFTRRFPACSFNSMPWNDHWCIFIRITFQYIAKFYERKTY